MHDLLLWELNLLHFTIFVVYSAFLFTTRHQFVLNWRLLVAKSLNILTGSDVRLGMQVCPTLVIQLVAWQSKSELLVLLEAGLRSVYTLALVLTAVDAVPNVQLLHGRHVRPFCLRQALRQQLFLTVSVLRVARKLDLRAGEFLDRI